MAYQTNEEETKNIRALFKNDPTLQGYKLKRNGHGSGTAYGWIEVTVTYPDGLFSSENINGRYTDDTWTEYRRIYQLIKTDVGRADRFDDIQTDYFCENISLTFQSESEYTERNQWKKEKKERLKKNRTCPNCGNEVKEFRRDGYRFVRACPRCETQWIHGCA